METPYFTPCIQLKQSGSYHVKHMPSPSTSLPTFKTCYKRYVHDCTCATQVSMMYHGTQAQAAGCVNEPYCSLFKDSLQVWCAGKSEFTLDEVCTTYTLGLVCAVPGHASFLHLQNSPCMTWTVKIAGSHHWAESTSACSGRARSVRGS